jgi:hypothetical protein
MGKTIHKAEDVAAVCRDRGCKARQARRVLVRLKESGAAPSTAPGPQRGVLDEEFLPVFQRYLRYEIDRDEAAKILGFSLSSFYRYARRLGPMLQD